MTTTRRHFLATAAGAGVLAPQSVSPNDRVRIALIGAGGQGSADTRNALSVGGVELAAVADIYDGRLKRAREVWGEQVFTTRDYREVLARKDVDAVFVATPDHWHSAIAIDAMNAGKDVYCEKPMVQQLSQGAQMIEAQKRTGRIVQVGSQRVSSIVYAKAKEMLSSGAIGELNMVEAWVDRDYGTGVPGDLFVHLISGLHFATGALGPHRVYATGALRFWKDGRDVPDVMIALYDYPTFNVMLRVNLVDGATETMGLRFIGSEGIMAVDNGVTISKVPRELEPGYSIDTFPKAQQEQFLKQYRQKYPARPKVHTGQMSAEESFVPPKGYSAHFEHVRNFIAAVRGRQPVLEDAVFGFRAAGPALLSNISYFEQKVCLWDAETMKLKA